MQAVLKSRAQELMFFGTYLQDRLTLAIQTGNVAKPLSDPDEVLALAATPRSIQVVVRLHRVRSPGRRPRPAPGPARVHDALEDSNRWSDDPLVRGAQAQDRFADRYFSFRWAFDWNRYVIVAFPDGLSRRYVYEFKSTRNLRYIEDRKAGARAQGDLYCLFYQRPTKRLHLYVTEQGYSRKWDEPSDRENALRLLGEFAAVDAGRLQPPAPPLYKCRACEFIDSCPVYRQSALRRA